jgi:hypothetical protein
MTGATHVITKRVLCGMDGEIFDGVGVVFFSQLVGTGSLFMVVSGKKRHVSDLS